MAHGINGLIGDIPLFADLFSLLKLDKEAADAQNQPDDEGWVTVGRSGRNPAAPRLDAAELQERRNKKKKVCFWTVIYDDL